jgi:hypothetical protein
MQSLFVAKAERKRANARNVKRGFGAARRATAEKAA